jgi:hypothetical protein
MSRPGEGRSRKKKLRKVGVAHTRILVYITKLVLRDGCNIPNFNPHKL